MRNFIGLHEVGNIEANTLVSVIEDTLLCANLLIWKIRGQCYDGSSNMSGMRNGAAKQIMERKGRALYTHCYGHTLSLASMDAVKGCQLMKRYWNVLMRSPNLSNARLVRMILLEN